MSKLSALRDVAPARTMTRQIPSENLRELFELAEEAMSYTPQYFRNKWSMDERLAKLRELLFPTETNVTEKK